MPVRPRPVDTCDQPRGDHRRRHQALHLALRTGGALLAPVAIFLCAAAATGILYMLRQADVLGAGPDVRGALPLQQLAGGEAQPLVRLVVAWLPAGSVATLVLAFLTPLRPATRALAVAVGVFAVLFVAGAISDAVAVTDPLRPHLVPQLSRPATWVATALAFTGALLPRRWWRLAAPGRVASAA